MKTTESSLKSLAPSAALSNKVLHAAMARIGAVEDGISRADLREWLASNVEFTEWESEIYQRYNSTRWWTVLNFISTDAVRAGWIEKDNGVWSITTAGSDALDT